MTAQSTQARIPAAADTAASGADQEPVHGAEIVVPLNRLKASLKNARKVPHSAATIEAFAASIKVKGVLQPPVVEIERGEDGTATGNYLVTIGEGRRQGLRLLAKRKQIKRTHPVRPRRSLRPSWNCVRSRPTASPQPQMSCRRPVRRWRASPVPAHSTIS